MNSMLRRMGTVPTIFHKIVSKQIKADIVYEDDSIIIT